MADSPPRNPYPGLRPFRTDEEHLFFGRERQVDRMIAKLAAQHFLAVVGTSGSGKSSLVNCGLRPALDRGYMAQAGANWRMAQFRPGSDPIRALACALAAPGVLVDQPRTGLVSEDKMAEAVLRCGRSGLINLVERAALPPGTQLMLVADQFEELFRIRAGAEDRGTSVDAAAFVQLLLQAAAQRTLPIHVVLTMRSDFLGDCAQFSGLPEAINESQYLVPRLTRDEIRAAITGPAAVRSVQLGAVLVTRLLNDVGDNPDQLSILQHALNRTWAHWEKEGGAEGMLELADYEAVGTMSEALNRHAEKAYAELPDVAARGLCEKVFKALTDTGTDARGVRRMTRHANLCAITGAKPMQLDAVLAAFRKGSRSFVMPPEGEALGPESDIDISHESLMRVWQRLTAWADEEVQSARSFRDLRQQALQHAAGQANLWRDPELALSLEWRSGHVPNAAWAELYGGGFDPAMRFLDDSRDAQQAEQREAAVERRWLGGWQYLPVAMVALPFMWAQLHLARALTEDSRIGSVLKQLPAAWAGYASHLIAGIPAMLAFLVLAPFVKQRFRRWALADLQKQAVAGPAATEPTPRVQLETAKRAGFVRRAAAQVLDWAVAFVLLVAAALTAQFGFQLSVDGQDWFPATLGILCLMLWAYHVLSWKSPRQATPGQRLLGLQVVDLDGRRIGWWRGSARFFMRFLSYYSVGIGFLMQLFNAQRQTLHDRICGTLVLRRQPPPKG